MNLGEKKISLFTFTAGRNWKNNPLDVRTC
jgi:hypothetical protein